MTQTRPTTNIVRNVEELELELLLEALHRGHGLDLRSHPRASLARRLGAFAAEEGVQSLSELQARVLRDAGCLERLSHRVSVSVTSMFRDPGFWRHLREEIVPQLRTWPSVLVWVAGCATGEEVYSLNVVLHEEGLGSRAHVHATDRSRTLLAGARNATYPVRLLQTYESDYAASGGRGSLADHYAVRDDMATFKEPLRRNVTFSIHDLTADGRFNEFQLVLCRNVLTYLDEARRMRVLDLVEQSIVPFGILALGARENVALAHAPCWTELSRQWRTYKRTP